MDLLVYGTAHAGVSNECGRSEPISGFHYQMFCKRTENYMENLAAEKKAEEGEIASDKMPPFMARITDVCGMLSLACGRQDQELYLQIKDPIIGKNSGYFQWKISGEQSTAVKLSGKPEHVDLELTIGELASIDFWPLSYLSYRGCITIPLQM